MGPVVDVGEALADPPLLSLLLLLLLLAAMEVVEIVVDVVVEDVVDEDEEVCCCCCCTFCCARRSCLRNFARRFWNQTCNKRKAYFMFQINKYIFHGSDTIDTYINAMQCNA